jgi:hypothetical protein
MMSLRLLLLRLRLFSFFLRLATYMLGRVWIQSYPAACLRAFAFLFFSDTANSAARSSSHSNNNDSASEELESHLFTVLLASSSGRFFYTFI